MADSDQNYDLIKLFFKEKGLVRQHIESYNYFTNHEIKSIMQANDIVDSDIDHTFYLKYLDIRVGSPTFMENMIENSLYPQEINGGIFGISSQPEILVKLFRERRRSGKLNKFVSIFHNTTEKCIFISTDNGRICRPLITIDQNLLKSCPFLDPINKKIIDIFCDKRDFEYEKKVLSYLGILFDKEYLRYKSFSDLISDGKIEYLDANEENNSKIAFRASDITYETTHLEISEFTILGYVAGLVPFPHHNQSPRNTYQCAMGKQAIGHIATNVENTILQLNYTQRPMAASKTLDLVRYNEIPSGFNAMVAVMSYSGYDIEDAVILNKSSIDRGMARVEVYKTTTVNIKKHSNGQSEQLVPFDNNDGII